MPELNWNLDEEAQYLYPRLLPGKEDLAWVTNTVTPIYGERDAILVDTFLSVQHSKELLGWIAESGKNLTTIYVTHAHGHHFFGRKLLLDRVSLPACLLIGVTDLLSYFALSSPNDSWLSTESQHFAFS